MCTKPGLADGTGPEFFAGSKKPRSFTASKYFSGSPRLTKRSKPCWANSSPSRIISKKDSSFAERPLVKEVLHIHLLLKTKRRLRRHDVAELVKDLDELSPIPLITLEWKQLDVALSIVLGHTPHKLVLMRE